MPLANLRAEQLARCYERFFDEDCSYHGALHRFVHELVTTPSLRRQRPSSASPTDR